jgi:tRNA pseudouridine38-40 synthase
MERYFLELSYMGTSYAGFQIQQNATTIQSEVEKALEVFFRRKIELTGASRTDAGVHAFQNYFHFDNEGEINPSSVYNLNAILPADISIKRIIRVSPSSHSRFDASGREYKYFIYKDKNPFLNDRAYFYPYPVDLDLLNQAASIIMDESDFTSFSKRRTQVKTYLCKIECSQWKEENDMLVYYVKANRFLRGMVRGLVGTMLQVGRGKISLNDFKQIIDSRDVTNADFAVPAHGLFLVKVNYPESYFTLSI